MCILLWSYKQHPDFPLILAANRDEFFNRPADKAAFWANYPLVFAGRDLQAGGTWMGVTRQGRIAALTNVRDLSRVRSDTPSRGMLVSDYLTENADPKSYLEKISAVAGQYNPFNLMAGDQHGLYVFTGVDGVVKPLEPGIYGLSNWALNTSWPKVEKGRKVLQAVVENGLGKDSLDREPLFAMLADAEPPPDNQLPDTGVGLEWERILGSIFVKSPTYGTRCSTVLTVSRVGEVVMEERSFGAGGTDNFLGSVKERFDTKHDPA